MQEAVDPLIRIKRWVWVRSKLHSENLRRVFLTLCFCIALAAPPVAAAPGATPQAVDAGFAQKPLLTTTEMGTPEKELIAQEERKRTQNQQRYAKTKPAVVYSPGNTYVKGQCTWLMKERNPSLPNRAGNAGQWVRTMPNTGTEPRVGAIVITSESSYGHAAEIIELVDGKMKLVEMNYIRPYIVSSRWLATDSPVIRGYVYVR